MRTGIFLLLIGFLLPAQAETFRYVTDHLRLAMRSGTSTSNKILKMVPSGERVEILNTTPNGYSRVRTPHGSEGWMLTRHLMDQPAARNRVATADITTALLLSPPGRGSLPLAIFTVMANAPEALVGTLCLLYVGGAGVLLLVANGILTRNPKDCAR